MDQKEVTARRDHKDRLFCRLFGDERHKENLLSLYNALSHTDYNDPDRIEINTVDNIIYMGMHNDVSCIIDCSMTLFEQQSTLNYNMPLRGFMYFSQLFDKYLVQNGLNIMFCITGREIVKTGLCFGCRTHSSREWNRGRSSGRP